MYGEYVCVRPTVRASNRDTSSSEAIDLSSGPSPPPHLTRNDASCYRNLDTSISVINSLELPFSFLTDVTRKAILDAYCKTIKYSNLRFFPVNTSYSRMRVSLLNLLQNQ